MALCLPWWHAQFATLPRTKISSGCATVGGNVQCAPEAMRKAAETRMRALGYPIAISLADYTLARNIASEVGSGTPEEKVAVAEAAYHYSKGDVNALLLYRQPVGHPNRGYYGPIHGDCVQWNEDGKCVKRSAPYKRWAATSRDPAIDDLYIAQFVLAGKSKNFTGGANKQFDISVVSSSSILYNAKNRVYWVGPLPGVSHRRTFLYGPRKTIDPNSAEGKALIAQGLKAINSAAPDWSGLSVCQKPGTVFWPSLLVGIPLGLAIYLFGRHRWWPF